jgi:IS30 family transposase
LADYAFRSYHERQEIERMVEAGMSVKEIAGSLGISLSTVYAELRRGRDGTRLPDKRLRYNADLAQLSVQQGLERRGRRSGNEA